MPDPDPEAAVASVPRAETTPDPDLEAASREFIDCTYHYPDRQSP